MAVPVVGSIVAGIVGVAGSFLSKYILTAVAVFTALKVLLTGIFVLVLPIVINNFIVSMIDTSTQIADSYYQSGSMLGEPLIQATGFFAWVCNVMQVPAVLAVMITAMQVHLMLRVIPFSPVKK